MAEKRAEAQRCEAFHIPIPSIEIRLEPGVEEDDSANIIDMETGEIIPEKTTGAGPETSAERYRKTLFDGPKSQPVTTPVQENKTNARSRMSES